MTRLGGAIWLLDEPPDPARFTAPGWTIRSLDVGSGGGRRDLWVSTVDDDESAARVLEAAARGAVVAVHLELAGLGRQRFLEDLDRLGVAVREGVPDAPWPTEEQEELLGLLAAGFTVTAAAAQLNVSRRTTNRMLGEIRDLFGVDSNAQAVKVWAARSGHRSC